MFWWDPTMILVLIGVAISMWAQAKVQSSYSKFSRVSSSAGQPAYAVARQILDLNGLQQVKIEQIPGNLTDHFDPRQNVLRLSQTVYNSNSIAAIGVAVHEAGHAMQYRDEYFPMRVRGALVPVTQVCSTLAMPLIIGGLIFGLGGLARFGAIVFAAVLLFQLVTLPVEFNASGRALMALEGGGYLTRDEMPGAKKVLSAAALTYVAAAVTAALQLLRLVLLTRQD